MQVRTKVAAALVAISSLLCGYTLNGTLINWQYFGTPNTAGALTYDANGAPLIKEFTRTLPAGAGLPALPVDIASKIAFTLPEGRDIRLNSQGLVPDSDDKTNVRFSQTADVWVSFLSEGAGYRNSVGYFKYDPAHPPTSPAQVSEKVIFVNASMTVPLDQAGPAKQNTVYLGKFLAGEALGFFIAADGFSPTGRLVNGVRTAGVKDNISPKTIFYTLRALNPEAPSIQNLNVHTVMLRELSTSGPGYQLMVIGFEDINRESGGDHDFNDVVLGVHVNPQTAIANLTTLAPLVGAADVDSDGDGVKDLLDEYPADPTRAFSRSYPSATTWGTLAYEDQWPSRGDYDLNDVVMRYRTKEILNAQRNVAGLEIEVGAVARGAITDSGFGMHLPGVLASAVASATLSVNGGTAAPLTVESGQTEAVFLIMPSSVAALPSPVGCSFANTKAGCAAVPVTSYKLTVNFKTAQTASLFTSPYNPFIYRVGQRGLEVHLPGKPPTAKATASLFKTKDDNTTPGTTSTYMDSKRRPWALDVPTTWLYPQEQTDVIKAYPNIVAWALSSGTTNKDWYTTPVTSFTYRAP
jgi:LruC domain-containing protein